MMRMLLVEDERRVASFVARALREEAYAVDVADTGPKGLEMALDGSYDLILLDLRLPGMNGIEVCQALRKEMLLTPVLMLTARTLIEHKVEGLDAGADDYLTKPFALAELRARVRALLRRASQKGGPMLRCADLMMDRPRRIVSRGTTRIPLTTKEFALLEFLLLRAPTFVPRTEIIEHVWDSHFDSETNLVDVYISHLRQKIDHDHSLKLIHTIRGVGYRLGTGEV
jgi:DNA-binding response OmpR family regulator